MTPPKRKPKAEAPKKKPGKVAKRVEVTSEPAPQHAPLPTPQPVQPTIPPTVTPRAPPTQLPQKAEEKPESKPFEMAPIKAHEFDPHFKYEISKMHGGEELKRCFQCGTCTSDCPIARFSDSYRPRQIIRMAQLGLKDRVLSSDTLWLCAACFTCNDRCPQGVEVASVIRILRNAAVNRGIIPLVFKELGSSIVESGIAYRIPELRSKKRTEVGLPPLPKGNPEAIKKLADATSFSKTLKADERK